MPAGSKYVHVTSRVRHTIRPSIGRRACHAGFVCRVYNWPILAETVAVLSVDADAIMFGEVGIHRTEQALQMPAFAQRVCPSDGLLLCYVNLIKPFSPDIICL